MAATKLIECDTTQKIHEARSAVRDAERALELALQDARVTSSNQYFSFELTRTREIEERSTVVVEALPDDTLEQAEERLQDWIDCNDYWSFEDLDWDQLDEDSAAPKIVGPGEVIVDFDARCHAITVPIVDDDTD